MEKNNLEAERNQDPGPSNRPQISGAPVSNWNCSELDFDCFVAVKRLTLAEIEEMKRNRSQTNPLPPPQSGQRPGRSRASRTQKSEEENPNARRSVRIAKRLKPLTVENSTDSDLDEPTAMTQSSQVSPSPLSPMEIAPGCGVMQLPEEVFHHLLGFVTFDDIKAARLVNKHWRQVATTPLRRLSEEIRLDHTVFECVTKVDDGQFPVYRFEVQLYDDPEKIKICYPYFSGICAWVKELTLKMDMTLSIYDKSRIRVDTDTFPRDCIYQDLTHFNLRLSEKSPNTRHHEFWQGFTDFVQSIMKNSPNLREVNVNYLNNKSGRKLPICRVIEDLFPNSNSVGTSKLSCIDFQEVPLDKINLTKWSTLNLKLRKLGINLPRSSDLIDLLAKFLETQTGTLKELSLNLKCWDFKTNYYKTPTVAFTFPRMETLEQLGLTGYVYRGWRVLTTANFLPADRTVVTFPGIDYARLFPSLKKLDLRDGGIEWRDFFGNNLLQPTSTVEELIFLWTALDPTTVFTAANLFPCLRKLEICPNIDVMKAVCENMPSLEVLSLIGTGNFALDNYDYLITGMELHVCEWFQGVMSETWIKQLKTAERWSLARLQNLKTLKLSNRSYRRRHLICFSRLSFHVFQQMSSLKCLDLNGSADRHKYYFDWKERQFLAELREKFVVL